MIPVTIRGRLRAALATLLLLALAGGIQVYRLQNAQVRHVERTLSEGSSATELTQGFITAAYRMAVAGSRFVSSGTREDSVVFESKVVASDSLRMLLLRPGWFGVDELNAFAALGGLNSEIQVRVWQARLASRVPGGDQGETAVRELRGLVDQLPFAGEDIQRKVTGRARAREERLVSQLQRSKTVLAFGGALAAIATWVLGVMLLRSVTGPLLRLVGEVESLGRGELDAPAGPVGLPPSHEYARLRRALDESRARLKRLLGELTRLAAVVRSASDAILLVDDGGQVHSANAAASSLVEASAAELTSKPITAWLEDSSGARLVDALRALHGNGSSTVRLGVEDDFRVRRGTSSLVCEATITRTEDGRDRIFAIIIRDVTTRRAIEARLRQTERLAAISRLVGGIAHELNNPLAAISLSAELMAARSTTHEDREDLASVQELAQRAARIVRDLLRFVEEYPLRFRRMSALHFLEELLGELQAQLLPVRLDAELSSLPRDLDVCADAGALRQAIENVIVNGAQAAGPEGRVHLEASLRNEDLVLRVTDSGPGVPAEISKRIFEPFFSTRGVGGGAGLGLSVSLGILTQHDGTIHLLDATETSGATFVLSLPVLRGGQSTSRCGGNG